MAKHSSHILDMARKGAEHRYQELKAEIAQLVKNFPHVAERTIRVISRNMPAGSRRRRGAAAAEGPKPARRKMSAKARKAISDAQKKRWAAQKAAAAESAPPKAGKKR
jgi:hypothetical protein